MTAHLVRGDARRLPLATGSVQCVVTSPPYFGLRSYGGQTSIWGGDPDCPHSLEDGPALKPMTGGTGPTSKAQLRNNGSQFGNAWAVDAGKPKPAHRNGQGSHGLQDHGPDNRSPYLDALHKAGQFGNAWAVDAGKVTLPPQSANSTLTRHGPDGRSPYSAEIAKQHGPTGGATCTRCGAWRGELGSEPTPALFVAHLVEVFREVKRVLRDDGVCFLNIADSMAGSGKGPTGHNGIGDQIKRQGFRAGNNAGDGRPHDGKAIRNRDGVGPVLGTRPKSLLLVPERLSLALAGFSTVPGAALVQMADELATAREAGDWLMVSAVESQLRIWAAMSAVFDGWIIRSRIAWCKAAPMPESVDDRPTSAWEHVWMLTKSNKALFWTHRDGPGTRTKPAPDYRWRKDGVELTEEPEDAKENGWKRVNLWRGHDYYWDADAVREPNTEGSLARQSRGTEQPHHKLRMEDEAAVVPGINRLHCGTLNVNGLHTAGANMRNFWLLGPDPYPGSHFATFPREIPRRCILAATSEYGACAACGAAWKRVVDVSYTKSQNGQMRSKAGEDASINGWHGMPKLAKKTETAGWAPTCKCGPAAGVRPCVVLDPFSGSGTVPYQAARMGRIGIGVELSESYIAQAQNGRLAQGFLPLAAPPQPAAPRLPIDGEVAG